jgi:hypothetical protein
MLDEEVNHKAFPVFEYFSVHTLEELKEDNPWK